MKSDDDRPVKAETQTKIKTEYRPESEIASKTETRAFLKFLSYFRGLISWMIEAAVVAVLGTQTLAALVAVKLFAYRILDPTPATSSPKSKKPHEPMVAAAT